MYVSESLPIPLLNMAAPLQLPASDTRVSGALDSDAFAELLAGLGGEDIPGAAELQLTQHASMLSGLPPPIPVQLPHSVAPDASPAGPPWANPTGKNQPPGGNSLPSLLHWTSPGAELRPFAKPLQPAADVAGTGGLVAFVDDPEQPVTVAAAVRMGVVNATAGSLDDVQLMTADRALRIGANEANATLSPVPGSMTSAASETVLLPALLRIAQPPAVMASGILARTPGFSDDNLELFAADPVRPASMTDTLSSLTGSQARGDMPTLSVPGLPVSGTAVTLTSAGAPLPASVPMQSESGESVRNWSTALGQRMLLLAGNGVENARLQLSPANLGALDIQIRLEDDRAHVSFGVQNAATRDALEAALPRLRELFAAQGMELVQADVRDQDTPGQPQSRASAVTRSFMVDPAAGIAADRASPAWAVNQSEHSLDIYV